MSVYIQLLQLIITAVGGVFALIQWRKNVKLNQTQFADSLINKLRNDDEIRLTAHLFDSDYRNWFNKEFYDNAIFEVRVDKTLQYYSYICYLAKFRIITEHEFAFFKYEITVALTNKDCVDYLYNYYHYSQSKGFANAYIYLTEYADKMNLLDRDFKDKNAWKDSSKYSKVLEY